MAFEIPGDQITRVTAADLSNSQYRALVLDSSGLVNVAASAGVKTFGVLQNKPSSGKAATVMLDGVTKMIAGAAITLPALITTDASGRAIAATTGQFVLGQALQGAAAAGQVIAVALYRESAV